MTRTNLTTTPRMSYRSGRPTTVGSVVVTAAAFVLLIISTTTTTTTVCHAQTQGGAGAGAGASGWDESTRLDYSYDVTDEERGPMNGWKNVIGFGEWETESYYNWNIIQRGNLCDVTRNGRPSPLNLFQTSRCVDLHEPLPRQMHRILDNDEDEESTTTTTTTKKDCGRNDMTFAITPHSLKAYFPRNDDTCQRPTVTISGRIDPYVILWMELHAPSEHVMDGRRYDGELQMVHTGTGDQTGQLLTLSILLDATAEQENVEFQWLLNQWTTVAERTNNQCENRRRLLQQNEDDNDDKEEQLHQQEKNDKEKPLQVSKTTFHQNKASVMTSSDNSVPVMIRNSTLANRLPQQQQASSMEEETKQERQLQFTQSPCRTDRLGRGCEPFGPRQRMYPYNLWPTIWYFGYDGSLTSPPCTDIMSWKIFNQPMQISRRQYKQLANLLKSYQPIEGSKACQSDTDTSLEGTNNRPLQNLNANTQSIYHCTPDSFGYFVYPPEQQ